MLTLRSGLAARGSPDQRLGLSVKRLRDPSQRTVSLIVTDATRKGWSDGQFPALLVHLKGPRALMMTLPAALWPRTALQRCIDPDDALTRELLDWNEEADRHTPAVALVSLDPARMAAWARSLLGGRRFRPCVHLPLAPAPAGAPRPILDGEAAVATCRTRPKC